MNEPDVSKQHPIPQNFMDVEFKIVGDFTVRQFTYLCATGLPMYLIYSSPLQNFLKFVLVGIFGIFGFFLVFVPIDDRSMDVWIVNFFRSVYSNNRRVWRKTPSVPKTLSMETLRIVQGEMITLAPTSSRRKLEEYLKGIKEEAPDEFDFDFKKFKYEGGYEPPKAAVPVPETLYETPIAVPEAKPQEVVPQKPAYEEVVLKMPEVSKPIQPKPVVEEVVIKPQPVIEKQKEFIKKIAQPIMQVPSSIKEIIKPKPKVEAPVDVHEEFRTSSADVPGRKFVSFGQKEQEIILPIRGEKTISILAQQNTDSTLNANKDIRTLTKELKTLVREIKQEEVPSVSQALPVSNEIVLENNLAGICFDQNNTPLPNLLLALLDNNSKELQYSRSDNLGKFTFRDLEKGNYKIKVLNPEIYALNFDIINFSIDKFPYSLVQVIGKK